MESCRLGAVSLAFKRLSSPLGRLATSVFNVVFFSLCLLSVAGSARATLPFSSTTNLYVSMWSGDEIVVFSPQGQELRRFTANGLDGPRGAAFHPSGDEFWVASELGNAIFIFGSEHQLLRKIEHPDFDEPVGITFSTVSDADREEPEVFISNSNGNEILVFTTSGNLLRRISHPSFNDPNCSAFLDDGSLLVTNRLGGSSSVVGSSLVSTPGSVTMFDSDENFVFDFTTNGIVSLMAVARHPGSIENNYQPSVWVTSGGGDQGIYQFDLDGNLLRKLLPSMIGDGRSVVPQGLAIDERGHIFVASQTNEIIELGPTGDFIRRFPTGDGTSRSLAIQGCATSDALGCSFAAGGSVDTDDEGGGGQIDLWMYLVLVAMLLYRPAMRCEEVYSDR